VEARNSTGERADPVLIAARLLSEFGYSPASADITARDLIGCSEAVWDAFSCWWQTGAFGPLEVEGFSAAQLVRDHGLLAPGAFLMLDWLLKNPNEAKAALRRGHDSVGHGPARRTR
jgi:hypothetical protein